MPRKRTPKRKVIARYGRYGSTVLISKRGPRVMVQWRDVEGRRMLSFRGDDAEEQARLYAGRLLHEDNTEKAPPVTMADVWKRYQAGEHYTRGLSERSKTLYASAWKLWLRINQGTEPAEKVDAQAFEETRKKLEALESERGTPYGTNTIKSTLQVIKSTLSWAAADGAITHNAAVSFRFRLNKHTRPKSPDEYERDEFELIMDHLPAHGSTRSRSRDVILLLGYQGVRATAAVHLRWEDVTWETNSPLRWQAEWDKTGRTWDQEIHAETKAMLTQRWEAEGRPTSGWVFSGQQRSKPYTIQALWDALVRAEEAAGIQHKPNRAMHGMRRMVAGDIRAVTGSDDAAMAAIGKVPAAAVRPYLKARPASATHGIRDIPARSASSSAGKATASDPPSQERAGPA